MTARKTDAEVLNEYCDLMDMATNQRVFALKIMLPLVHSCRKDEPRINSGQHLLDYTMICDEDDTMDSFYGPDYEWGDE